MISKLTEESGIREAERKFGVGIGDKRPILLLTDVHPDACTNKDQAIKIQLGNYGNENQIRDFLFKLTRFVSSGEYGKVLWDIRKQRIREIAGRIPIVEIVGVATGVLPPR